MRRILLFFLFAFFCIRTCLAQPAFGIKGGFSLNSLHTNDNAFSGSTGLHIDYTFGITLDLKASEQFTVQPEFNYLRMEAKDANKTLETWKYSYLTLPVLLKYRAKNSGFGLYTGPQLGFLVSGSSTLNGVTTDIKSLMTKNDVSAVFGFDYHFDNNIRVDFRYQYSFFNTLKTEAANPSINQNRVFSATIGYVFKGRK